MYMGDTLKNRDPTSRTDGKHETHQYMRHGLHRATTKTNIGEFAPMTIVCARKKMPRPQVDAAGKPALKFMDSPKPVYDLPAG